MPREKPYHRNLSHGLVQTVSPRGERETDLIWDTEQKGLCLRVKRSGSKSYKVAYQHEGKTRWFTIGSHRAVSLKFAREKAEEVREQAANGEDPQGEKVRRRLAKSLKFYHEVYLIRKAQKRNKSWKQAAALMEKHVLRKLGRKKLKDITRRDMWEIFDSLHEHPVLANAVINSASAVFSWAVKRELIESNPCHGIERHKTSPKERFLSNDEIRAVWPAFEQMELRGTILKLVLLTAQRPGEVRQMRWEHLDLDAGLWSMPGTASLGWPGTKNHHDHQVPLAKPVLELLRTLDPQAAGYVFPSPTRRGRPISGVSAQQAHKLADIKPFRVHDLRATAATGMDALGIIRQHIALVLNHVQGGVTASYIRHDKRTHKKQALEKWATELTAILEGEGRTDHRADVVSLLRT